MINTQITFDNFFPENVEQPPIGLLPAFKAMLVHLESDATVKFMCWSINELTTDKQADCFEKYITQVYLYPNVGTNNFYNFYRELYLRKTGKEFEGTPDKETKELRINWLKAAIANIEARTKPHVKRAMKLSDTKVYKVLKKGLADNPSEFQKVYKGLKWAWDTFPDRSKNNGSKREVEFNKNLGCIAYWALIPIENWDYWCDLADKFFPNWQNAE